MKEIKLSQGKVALVDDEDFGYLNQFKWSAVKFDKTYYASRHTKTIDGERHTIKMHREILKLSDRKIHVDHQDHNGLNNQKSNIRACTMTENARNREKFKNKSTQYKGVFFNTKKYRDKVYGYWRVRIRGISIGNYKTEEEAAVAYNEKVKEIDGEFAYSNIIKKVA